MGNRGDAGSRGEENGENTVVIDESEEIRGDTPTVDRDDYGDEQQERSARVLQTRESSCDATH